MSLRSKISLWMAAAIALFSFLTWGVQRLVVIPSFNELEHGIAREAVARMTATISRERENLHVRCLEWANWDDTYRFVQDHHQAYVEMNLNDEWFSKYRLNLMLFCDSKGEVIWGELRSSKDGAKLDSVSNASQFVSISPAALDAVARGAGELSGIALTQRGPMLIAGSSIHKNDGSGASAGLLIIGSLLGDLELADMAGLQSGSVGSWDLRKPLPSNLAALLAKLEPAGSVACVDSHSQLRSACTVLTDTANSPALLVQARFNNDILNRGLSACRLALIAVLLIGLLMLVLVLSVLNRSVLRPVLSVIDHVVGIGLTNDLKLRVQGTAPGELGILLSELNHMLDRLAEDNARRLEAEARLCQAEMKYRRIFEDSVVGLFQSTPDGRHMSVNDAFARHLGYADAGEFENALHEIATQVYVHPAQREEILRRIEAEGPLTAFEIQFRRKDGGTCWVSLTARVDRDETGNIRFYEGSIENITQRKLAQDELHKLSRAVDQSPASIVITDPDGKIEYANRKFVETTGYAVAEALGRKPSILKSGLMPDRVYGDLWQTIVAGREWRGELQNRKKNGELYWEWASISPLLDAEGKVTHFLAVKEDITHRKEADETLRRTLEQVERFNRLAIGRERRIIELKAAINELLGRLGEPPRYQAALNSAIPERGLSAEVTPV